MEKVSSSLAVLAEKLRKKGLDLEFHLGGNLKIQICCRKTFHFFHVCLTLIYPGVSDSVAFLGESDSPRISRKELIQASYCYKAFLLGISSGHIKELEGNLKKL